MNYELADAFLAEFEDLSGAANMIERTSDRYWSDPEWVRIDHRLQSRMQSAKQIADEILPGSAEQFEPVRNMSDQDWGPAHRCCIQLRGMIDQRERVAEILGPTGPLISATGLHRWVWEEAASAWDAGLRRAAIQAAGSRVDRETQVKLRRSDISGVDLARQAWSASDPTPANPRLRPEGFGAPGSQSYKSALDGARDFHAGTMARIRNLATHELDEPDEQVALEQLAALSVLARWIEEAEVAEA